MCVLNFSTRVSKYFLILSRTERCDHKCTHVYMQSSRYYCQVLKKIEFSLHNLKKKVFKHQIVYKSVQ